MSNFRQVGDPPLNPSGYNGWTDGLRHKRIQLRELMLQEMDEPCPWPEYAGLTWKQAIVKMLFNLSLAGEQWAVRELLNRAYGRIPLTVNLDAKEALQLVVMLPDNGRPRASHAPPVNVVDVEPEGSTPLGTQPNALDGAADGEVDDGDEA